MIRLRILLFFWLCLIPTLGLAQTNVSGVISSNTTWNTSGSPYVLTGSILIPTGVTLSINPGVQVVLNGNFKILNYGSLKALGSATDSINFTLGVNVNKWGGIRIESAGSTNDSTIIQYCKFKNAVAPGGTEIDGGAIFSLNTDKLRVSHSSFSECSADVSYTHPSLGGKGGAIAIINGSIEIANCTFRNCDGNVQGGAIYSSYSTTHIRGSIFENCKALHKGGACASNYSTFEVESSYFITDSVGSNQGIGGATGGALSLNSCNTCLIKNNFFSKNFAFGKGGGIAFEGQGIILDSNTFFKNKATQDGGGIHANSGISTLLNNVVDSNDAANGGGIFKQGGSAQDTMFINGGSISFNVSQSEGGGIRSNGLLKLSGVLIRENHSSNGAGIFTYADIVIDRCLFIKNTSSSNGGGIFTDKKALIYNSVFYGNIASENGGAMALFSNQIKQLVNNDIINNYSKKGGGLYCENNCSPSIFNSILYSNKVSNNIQSFPNAFFVKNQIYIHDQSSQPTIRNCFLEGGITMIATNGNLYTGLNANNLISNPGLSTVDTSAQSIFLGLLDFNLDTNSILINSADTVHIVESFNKDLVGNLRIIGCLPDIGAIENSKFFQNPFTLSRGTVNVFGSKCDTNRLLTSSLSNDSSLTFSWFRDNQFLSQGAGSFIAENAGLYHSVASIPNSGCGYLSSNLFVNVTPKIGLTASNQDALCFGDSTGNALSNIITSSISSITWRNSVGAIISNDTNLYGMPGGGYTLTVIDTGGCSATRTVIISAPPQIQLTSTSSPVSCNGDSDGELYLTVSNAIPPYSISWSSTSSANDTIGGLTAGLYTATVVDSNLCTNSAQFTVTQPAAIAVQVLSTTNVSCYSGVDGATIVGVTGGNGSYTSSWRSVGGTSILSTSTSLSGVPSGTYRYKVVDLKGCSDSVDVTITQPAAPLSVAINSHTDVLCYGASTGSLGVAAAGGTQGTGYQYLWQNSSGSTVGSSAVVNGLPAGVYTCLVTDTKGCSTSITDTLLQPASAVSLTSNGTSNVSCFGGNNGLAWVNPIGGTPPYSYSWNNGNSNDTASNLVAGSYTVTVTDNNNCVYTQGYTITQPTLLINSYTKSSYYGNTNVSCPGGLDGSIDLTPSGGTPPYSYSWSTGSTSQDLSGVGAGSYSCTITDFKGCTSIATVTMTEPTAFTWNNTITDVTCNGLQNGSIVTAITGGNAPYIVDWSSSANKSNKTEVTFRVDLSQQSISTLGIGAVIQGQVGVLGLTDLYGDSVFIGNKKFNPGDTIYWRYFNGSNAETVPIACGAITSLSVFERYLVVPDHDTILPIVCFSSCIQCNGTVGNGMDGTIQTTSKTLNNLGAGNYTYNLVDRNGCLSSQTVSVIEPSSLLLTSSSLDPTCPQNADGEMAVMGAGGTAPYTYLWSTGSTNDTVANASKGTYWVYVSDANGCADTVHYSLTAPEPFDFEEICVLSVDSATGKNLIVWDKTANKRTSDYVILKENAQGQFVQAGTQPYVNLSVYADLASNPQAQPDRYKLALIDSCGNYSDTSDYHRTIHLQSNLGTTGDVNLTWTGYEGKPVQSYELWRWVTAGNLVQIATVAASVTSYTDLNPPVAPNVYYVVNAIFPSSCSPTSGKTTAFDVSKSNILNQTGISIDENWALKNVKVYPNPNAGIFTIEFINGFEAEQISIVDGVGRIIRDLSAFGENTISVDLSNEPKGVYRISIRHQNGQTNLPIVVQ